jgi:hypothetical protein
MVNNDEMEHIKARRSSSEESLILPHKNELVSSPGKDYLNSITTQSYEEARATKMTVA